MAESLIKLMKLPSIPNPVGNRLRNCQINWRALSLDTIAMEEPWLLSGGRLRFLCDDEAREEPKIRLLGSKAYLC